MSVVVFLLVPQFSWAAAPANHKDSLPASGSVVVVAGEEYANPPGGNKKLLGENYRDLWTMPIEVEVLDMKNFAGGLTPVMRVGGFQSAGLALRGNDGRDYTFRPVNKEYSDKVIPSVFRDTFVEDIIQDQISGHFPAAQLVAGPIETAAGVLGVPQPQLVVMPNDPALGDFRESFAGVLGLIVEFPQPVSNSNPGYHSATEILGRKDYWKKRRADPKYMVDSRAYLRARLIDPFLNDWDRHAGNWRWGRLPHKLLIQPMPEDRDQVFSSFEGLSLDFARLQGAPFVTFGQKYESFQRLLHNGWDIDRYILSDIEKNDWMQVAQDVQSRLTDDVIYEGLRRMPREYYALRGEEIATILKSRRDGIVEMAERYYLYLAKNVDIYCTNVDEVVTIKGAEDGSVLVTVAATQGDSVSPHYFRRIFYPNETNDIRIYLKGGTDTVRTVGRKARGLNIRVVGGPGINIVDNSQGFAVKQYGAEGENRVVGNNGSKIDTKPYIFPPKESPNDLMDVPPKDWGSSLIPTWVGAYHHDPGLVVGTGIDYKRFGFRKNPWASRHVLKGAWGFGAQSALIDYEGDWRAENSKLGLLIKARVSGLDYLRFHGLGNSTQYDENNESIYQINTTQYKLFPAIAFHENERSNFALGPIAKYTDSTNTNPNTILVQEQPLGFENFGQVGFLALGVLDTRGASKALSPGMLLKIEGAHYIEAWDVEDAFSYLEARVGGWFRISDPLLASLHVRGKKVWGEYPYFEAAYIGGDKYPLGTRWNRWAGDSSLGFLGSIRWTVMKLRGVFPGHLGVFGMVNTARVFLEGEDDASKWHPSYGAGLMLTTYEHSAAFHLGMGSSADSGFFVMFQANFAADMLK